MSYIILVNDDDTLYGSKKERIMQRQKLVNDLVFIVDPIYRNTHDMTNASVMMEYVLPVSRKYKSISLVLSDERYNDCYLQYKLPFDTDLTSEAGSLELQLTFAYVEMTHDGFGIQRVRKTSPTTIEIIPITAWSDIIPDGALSALDQRLIKLDAQTRALNDYMNVIENNKVDNIVFNEAEDTLQLTSNGIGIGNKVSIKNMLDEGIPVVRLDFNDNNDSKPNDGCNCGCEDNIVEFGDSLNNTDDDIVDNNVIEF